MIGIPAWYDLVVSLIDEQGEQEEQEYVEKLLREARTAEKRRKDIIERECEKC